VEGFFRRKGGLKAKVLRGRGAGGRKSVLGFDWSGGGRGRFVCIWSEGVWVDPQLVGKNLGKGAEQATWRRDSPGGGAHLVAHFVLSAPAFVLLFVSKLGMVRFLVSICAGGGQFVGPQKAPSVFYPKLVSFTAAPSRRAVLFGPSILFSLKSRVPLVAKGKKLMGGSGMLNQPREGGGGAGRARYRGWRPRFGRTYFIATQKPRGCIFLRGGGAQPRAGGASGSGAPMAVVFVFGGGETKWDGPFLVLRYLGKEASR